MEPMTPATTDPLLLKIRDAARAEADPEFDFVTPGTVPWCAPPANLAATRVAMITTSALHLRGAEPFTTLENKLGDTSYRLIPQEAAASALDLEAPYVDPRHIPKDPEVALPRRALAELHRRGRIGAPASRHASFSPGIIRPQPGLSASAASLIELFRADGVGAALLLPTCPLCVQTVCLLAREIERAGIATGCVSLVPPLSRLVGAPRVLELKFPFGAPCGDPGHGALHQAVLAELLDLIASAAGPVHVESRLAWRRAPQA